MDKSSKLINKSLSLNEFNFGAFSSSPNWIGFFERKSKFSINLIDQSLDIFKNFFKKENEDIIIVTALSFDDKRERNNEIINKYNAIYEKMKKNGVLLPMTSCYESYLYGDIPLPASALNFYFDKNIFIELSKIMMCHSGIIGDICFYINKDMNIAIYPHEDVGFGCMSLNGDRTAGIQFLNTCSKNNNFRVVFNK
ncbi:hypothetical protein [Obesumbacterium proteus]|uniref:hypothetical protein n=1 Tax=Obesumbacterium proteus TaxID=82983 RepID=UPI00242C7A67|nr:hypothetical protein [Obesumbacterium proteus]